MGGDVACLPDGPASARRLQAGPTMQQASPARRTAHWSVFFIFIFFKKKLQKYIFCFRFYSSIPLLPGRGAAGGLPPDRRAVGTYM